MLPNKEKTKTKLHEIHHSYIDSGVQNLCRKNLKQKIKENLHQHNTETSWILNPPKINLPPQPTTHLISTVTSGQQSTAARSADR